MPRRRPSKLKPERETQPGPQPANPRVGFYSSYYTQAEMTLIHMATDAPTLEEEIWLQRVMNRRLLLAASEAAQGGETDLVLLTRVAAALTTGTGRVAKLLRDKRALTGEAADGLAGAIAQALDEIGIQMSLPL